MPMDEQPILLPGPMTTEGHKEGQGDGKGRSWKPLQYEKLPQQMEEGDDYDYDDDDDDDECSVTSACSTCSATIMISILTENHKARSSSLSPSSLKKSNSSRTASTDKDEDGKCKRILIGFCSGVVVQLFNLFVLTVAMKTSPREEEEIETEEEEDGLVPGLVVLPLMIGCSILLLYGIAKCFCCICRCCCSCKSNRPEKMLGEYNQITDGDSNDEEVTRDNGNSDGGGGWRHLLDKISWEHLIGLILGIVFDGICSALILFSFSPTSSADSNTATSHNAIISRSSAFWHHATFWVQLAFMVCCILFLWVLVIPTCSGGGRSSRSSSSGSKRKKEKQQQSSS